jgi:hypothetical protein
LRRFSKASTPLFLLGAEGIFRAEVGPCGLDPGKVLGEEMPDSALMVRPCEPF